MEVCIFHGAEAIVTLEELEGCKVIRKTRIPKKYRIKELDDELTLSRTRKEAKCLGKCHLRNCRTPKVIKVDSNQRTIWMEYIKESQTIYQHYLKNSFNILHATEIGKLVAEVHNAGVIHGDLTTNFGLSFVSNTVEDRAVDLYVLTRSIESSLPFSDEQTEDFNSKMMDAYFKQLDVKSEVGAIRKRFEVVKMRGRKKIMVG